MRSFNHDLWLKNREKEFIAFINNETWILIFHFLDITIIDFHWIYAIKNEDFSHYKSRFYVKDFSQYYDINYEEIYASIIKPKTLHILFAIITHRNYQIHEMNIIMTFLNNILKEIIYIKQIEGFVDSEYSDWVYLLRKALYELKQFIFEWYNIFKVILESTEL